MEEKNYTKLGGWLLVFTVWLFLNTAVVFLGLIELAKSFLKTFELVSIYGAGKYFLLFVIGNTLSFLVTLLIFGIFIAIWVIIRKRKQKFLSMIGKLLITILILNISSLMVTDLIMLSMDAKNFTADYVTNRILSITVAAGSAIIWSSYFKNSLRVAIYFQLYDKNELREMNIISDNNDEQV